VHSKAEVEVVSDWFGVPPEKISFVFLQRAPIEVLRQDDFEKPYVIAMGSAQRDYATLIEALRKTGLPAKIVSSHRSLQGLLLPDNVEHLSGLSAIACHELALKASFSVVPLSIGETAAGQVTIVEAMRLGKAVIATRAPGTVDYIQHEETGLLVNPNDSDDLARSMARLWDNPELRGQLSANASSFVDDFCSDQAASSSLARILLQVQQEVPRDH
jgi:glycosyltransferase involved in cell wall biosynthesis